MIMLHAIGFPDDKMPQLLGHGGGISAAPR